MARQLLQRYIWLIDTIRNADGITFEEINDRWIQSALNDKGKPLPLRTFHDHRAAILDEFGIDITCDRRNNTYRIADEFNEHGSIRSTLIDALVLNSAVREDPDLNHKIVFNDSFHQVSLPKLVRAIQEHRSIQFKYKRDYTRFRAVQARRGVPIEEWEPDVVRYLDLEPYGLYFNTLWFVVGRIVSDGQIHVYALHRIKDIQFLDSHFAVPEDFDVKEYLSEFSVDEEELEEEGEPGDASVLECFEAGLLPWKEG